MQRVPSIHKPIRYMNGCYYEHKSINVNKKPAVWRVLLSNDNLKGCWNYTNCAGACQTIFVGSVFSSDFSHWRYFRWDQPRTIQGGVMGRSCCAWRSCCARHLDSRYASHESKPRLRAYSSRRCVRKCSRPVYDMRPLP